MAAHGKLEQFHVGRDNWESYEERLQQYFVANNIKEAKKQRAIFLCACGLSQENRIPHYYFSSPVQI